MIDDYENRVTIYGPDDTLRDSYLVPEVTYKYGQWNLMPGFTLQLQPKEYNWAAKIGKNKPIKLNAGERLDYLVGGKEMDGCTALLTGIGTGLFLVWALFASALVLSLVGGSIFLVLRYWWLS